MGVPRGQTVDQHCYLQVLTTLGERIRRKPRELWKNDSYVVTMPYLLSGFWPKIDRQCYNAPLTARSCVMRLLVISKIKKRN